MTQPLTPTTTEELITEAQELVAKGEKMLSEGAFKAPPLDEVLFAGLLDRALHKIRPVAALDPEDVASVMAAMEEAVEVSPAREKLKGIAERHRAGEGGQVNWNGVLNEMLGDDTLRRFVRKEFHAEVNEVLGAVPGTVVESNGKYTQVTVDVPALANAGMDAFVKELRDLPGVTVTPDVGSQPIQDVRVLNITVDSAVVAKSLKTKEGERSPADLVADVSRYLVENQGKKASALVDKVGGQLIEDAPAVASEAANLIAQDLITGLQAGDFVQVGEAFGQNHVHINVEELRKAATVEAHAMVTALTKALPDVQAVETADKNQVQFRVDPLALAETIVPKLEVLQFLSAIPPQELQRLLPTLLEEIVSDRAGERGVEKDEARLLATASGVSYMSSDLIKLLGNGGSVSLSTFTSGLGAELLQEALRTFPAVLGMVPAEIKEFAGVQDAKGISDALIHFAGKEFAKAGEHHVGSPVVANEAAEEAARQAAQGKQL